MRTTVIASAALSLLVVATPLSATIPTVPTINDDVHAVIRDYYDAIDRGDLRKAYRIYGHSDDYRKFAAGFASTARVRVTMGPATEIHLSDVQASTVVYVDVYATLKNGRRQHFRGNYTLFRDFTRDGSAPSAWRITTGCLSSAGAGPGSCAYQPYRA